MGRGCSSLYLDWLLKVRDTPRPNHGGWWIVTIYYIFLVLDYITPISWAPEDPGNNPIATLNCIMGHWFLHTSSFVIGSMLKFWPHLESRNSHILLVDVFRLRNSKDSWKRDRRTASWTTRTLEMTS